MKSILVGGSGRNLMGAGFVALALVGSYAPLARADDVPYTQADATACTEDAFRFCSSVIPNESAIQQCLDKQAQRHRLSSACAARFEADAKH